MATRRYRAPVKKTRKMKGGGKWTPLLILCAPIAEAQLVRQFYATAKQAATQVSSTLKANQEQIKFSVGLGLGFVGAMFAAPVMGGGLAISAAGSGAASLLVTGGLAGGLATGIAASQLVDTSITYLTNEPNGITTVHIVPSVYPNGVVVSETEEVEKAFVITEILRLETGNPIHENFRETAAAAAEAAVSNPGLQLQYIPKQSQSPSTQAPSAKGITSQFFLEILNENDKPGTGIALTGKQKLYEHALPNGNILFVFTRRTPGNIEVFSTIVPPENAIQVRVMGGRFVIPIFSEEGRLSIEKLTYDLKGLKQLGQLGYSQDFSTTVDLPRYSVSSPNVTATPADGQQETSVSTLPNVTATPADGQQETSVSTLPNVTARPADGQQETSVSTSRNETNFRNPALGNEESEGYLKFFVEFIKSQRTLNSILILTRNAAVIGALLAYAQRTSDFLIFGNHEQAFLDNVQLPPSEEFKILEKCINAYFSHFRGVAICEESSVSFQENDKRLIAEELNKIIDEGNEDTRRRLISQFADKKKLTQIKKFIETLFANPVRRRGELNIDDESLFDELITNKSGTCQRLKNFILEKKIFKLIPETEANVKEKTDVEALEPHQQAAVITETVKPAFVKPTKQGSSNVASNMNFVVELILTYKP